MRPSELPSRALVVAVHLGVGACGLLAVSGYLLLVQREGAMPVPAVLFPYLAGSTGAMLGANVVLLAWLSAPIGRLRRELEAGRRPLDLDPGDVRRALSLDVRSVMVHVVTWIVPAALFPVFAFATVGSAAKLPVHLFVMGLSAGVLVSYTGFYTFAWLQVRRIAPVLLTDGLAHLHPFRPKRVFHHLIGLVLLLGAVMPACVVTLLVSGHATPALVTWLGVDFLFVGLFASGAVLWLLSRPLGGLIDRVGEVGAGDLAAQAPVEGLDTLGILSDGFNQMTSGLRERERIRETFGRYVTRQVADEILAGRVRHGGERRVATVLFADIRGFTRMSESMSPEEVVAFLNRYLQAMVACVLEHGGVLDKFIGDALMGLFGVPVGRGDVAADAHAAVRCALAMSCALDVLNAERAAAGEQPVEIGIAVHTGELIAGSIGSPERMEFTVIGDTVNLASRIEGLTKTVGRRILVSSATAALLDGQIALEAIGPMEVRGRAKPVEIFAA